MLCSFFKYVERTYSTPTITAPYGIDIKRYPFLKRARPVIYGTKEEKKLLLVKMRKHSINYR